MLLIKNKISEISENKILLDGIYIKLDRRGKEHQ